MFTLNPLYSQNQISNNIDSKAVDDLSSWSISLSSDSIELATGTPPCDRNRLMKTGYIRIHHEIFLHLLNTQKINSVEDSSITQYPTPVSNIVIIRTNSVRPLKALLFNTSGQELGRYNLNFGKNQINVKDLPSGWYTLKVYEEELYLDSFRFVK